MTYRKMGVRHFISASKHGKIDLERFYSNFYKELEKVEKNYKLMSAISKPVPGKLKQIKKNTALAGLPVSAKDCICVSGVQSAAGSRILEGYTPPFDATSVARIKEEGGVVVGKTNQDEFGFGTFSTNSGFNIPRNPLNKTRSCGGSSGGAAALVATMDFPHIALAQSTGGSISCPASFCGVVGLTPTYGLVSRYGLIDYANSLDKIGPIGRKVEDVALMLSVIAGHDPKDSTSLAHKPERYVKGLDTGIRNMKIGVPKEYFGEGVDDEVSKKVWDAIKKLESLGASYKKISLPLTKHAVSTYYIIACAEASTNLAKLCGMRYGASEPMNGNFNEYFSKVRTRYFGEEAKRRILLGTYTRMAGYRDQYYLKAMKIRTLIINEFKQAFKKFDVLAAPTMPVIAPRFPEVEKMTPLQNYMMDILTVAPNLAGIPMISVPCGTTHGMPVGLHLMADHLQEGRIIRAAHALESEAKK
jgi:aspartyl-tRNA(Asn)/glutamyl-tRNA(Gln) amidotransferase subunit A